MDPLRPSHWFIILGYNSEFLHITTEPIAVSWLSIHQLAVWKSYIKNKLWVIKTILPSLALFLFLF